MSANAEHWAKHEFIWTTPLKLRYYLGMANIELPDSTANRLNDQARAEGLSLGAFLQVLANSRFPINGNLPQITGEELDRLLDEEASEDSAYEGTYSRADIYLDHD
jgi:hypothetical protein